MLTIVRQNSETPVPYLVDAAQVLTLEMDVAPSRVVEGNVWVGEGEGMAMPVEVSLVMDAQGEPPNWKALGDAFAAARALRLTLDGAMVEREVLALTRLSVTEGRGRWSRMRVSLILAPEVMDLSELTTSSGGVITDQTGKSLLGASLW